MATAQTMTMDQAKQYLRSVGARAAGKTPDGATLFKLSSGLTVEVRRATSDTVTVQARMDGCAC